MRIPGPDHPITIEVTRGRVLVHVAGKILADTAWTYEQAYPSVAAIKSHLAFYPNRVERIEVRVDQDG